jgi:hypothetical protein
MGISRKRANLLLFFSFVLLLAICHAAYCYHLYMEGMNEIFRLSQVDSDLVRLYVGGKELQIEFLFQAVFLIVVSLSFSGLSVLAWRQAKRRHILRCMGIFLFALAIPVLSDYSAVKEGQELRWIYDQGIKNLPTFRWYVPQADYRNNKEIMDAAEFLPDQLEQAIGNWEKEVLYEKYPSKKAIFVFNGICERHFIKTGKLYSIKISSDTYQYSPDKGIALLRSLFIITSLNEKVHNISRVMFFVSIMGLLLFGMCQSSNSR